MYSGLKFLIAGYGYPAELAVTVLFEKGVRPRDIFVLTHHSDERNNGFHSMLSLRGIEFIIFEEVLIDEICTKLSGFKPDYLFSIHFRKIIPDSILKLVNVVSVNLHPSLLPKYKGANSNFWVIFNGEKYTGFTYHIMLNEIDSGPVVFQRKFKIDINTTSFSLFHRQIRMGLEVFPRVLSLVTASELKLKSQIGRSSIYNRSIPFEGCVDSSWSLDKIDRFIRAMYFPPFERAYVVVANEKIYLESLDDYLNLL